MGSLTSSCCDHDPFTDKISKCIVVQVVLLFYLESC